MRNGDDGDARLAFRREQQALRIEGFVTPSGLPTWARIAIGVVVESLFLAYVFVVGRAAVLAGATGDVLAQDAGDVAPASAA